jgi:stage II sporulation protein D
MNINANWNIILRRSYFGGKDEEMKRLLLILIILLVLPGCMNDKNLDNMPEEMDEISDHEEFDSFPGENNRESRLVLEGAKPVNRALAAKMLALAAYSKNEINQLDKEIEYGDVQAEDWFMPYINAVAISDWFSMEGSTFRPFDLLTYAETEVLSKNFNIQEDTLSFEWESKEANQAINYREWFEVYEKIIEVLDIENDVVTDSFVLVGTPANVNNLKSWELVTDKGKYNFEGLSMDQFMDQKIKVLKRNNEIIGVLDILDENPTITNVWLDRQSESELIIFVGGAYRSYEVDESISLEKEQVIGDVSLTDHKVVNVELKEDIITGKVLRISNSEVLIEGLGTFPVASDRKVYSTHNDLAWRSMNQIIVGYSTADFIIKDGEICAALIKEPVEIENIRVLLRTSGFNALTHNEIKITSNVDYTVFYENEQMVYEKGHVLTIDANHPMLKDFIRIKPNEPNGRMEVKSIERAYGAPIYRGFLEISKGANGLYLVNEIPIEEYLYAVVPSEMPTSYGLEASKVQAICARSFAYSQFHGNSYAAYGAHVDDSVASQVYNNYRETEISIRAVNETSRLGLTHKGSVISTYFFSTSSGHTANSGHVWAQWDTRDFPTTTAEYLVGKPQFSEVLTLDLSQEEDFATFIKNDQYNAYDRDQAWYRWQVTMTKEQLEKSIENHLKQRYLNAPKLVKTLGEDNRFRTRPVETIGELMDIQVYSRQESGIITEMVFVGSEATVKVATEYNIRFLLAPKKYDDNEADISVIRKDGSKVNNASTMPSAFFTMEQKRDNANQLESITFYGGGYGHGVGMSQNGVKGMVDQGFSFEQVLKHFYTNSELKEIY